ncbi:MAG: hypothetical protein GY913_28860 [Proteobacteria bacterium]|nr:hypothetical protein [Pseudomonadota bacterium]MCP4920925.1 hypothetical protein [Pseudomonadota bacterium]
MAIALFLAMAVTYSPTGFPVDQGRDSSLTWNLWKLDRLDVEALREGGDGRVAWLVGASILREAVDEEVASAALEIGVAKFGFNRGASGLSAGFLDRVPLQEGDVVVHNVAANNFRHDWISFVDIPHWWLTTLFAPKDFWSFSELSVQERLEGSMNYAPRRFWTNHDDTQDGWFAATTPWLKHRSSKNEHTRHSGRETSPGFRKWALSDRSADVRRLDLERWDSSPEQFNAWGLERLAETCRAKGVTLILVEVPPTHQMEERLMTPPVLELWDAERKARGIQRLTKVPDDDYADFMHPNPRGREVLTQDVIELLSAL